MTDVDAREADHRSAIQEARMALVRVAGAQAADWTARRDQAIVTARLAGCSLGALAAASGLSKSGVVEVIRRSTEAGSNGTPPPHRPTSGPTAPPASRSRRSSA